MIIAKIIYSNDNKKQQEDYSESGKYDLILEDGKIIGSHGCSNRSFANHDLTEWRLDELKENNVDVVISNDKIVWEKDGDNSDTMREFCYANSKYEAIHCYR